MSLSILNVKERDRRVRSEGRDVRRTEAIVAGFTDGRKGPYSKVLLEAGKPSEESLP